MMGATGLKVAIVSAYILMIIINGLANTLPFFGRTTGEVSDAFPNLLTPLGYAFSIWGVLYVLLGVMVVRTLILPADMVVEPSVRLFLYAFIASCILNAGWLIAWHALKPGIALLVMLVLLASLIVTWIHAPDALWLKLPFSLYLGWISVATLLNITIVLSRTDLNALTTSFGYVLTTLLFGTLLVAFVLFFRGDVPYALVFIWAYTAIFLRHLFEGNTLLYGGAGAFTILILLLTLWTAFTNGYALYGD